MHSLADRDAAEHAHVYITLLGWPVAAGHSYRPDSGCTCLDGTTAQLCPRPGAHPLASNVVVASPDRVDREFTARPGTGVIAPTLGFDAVVLPRPVAMFALVQLERRSAQVPCVVNRHQAVLLVAPRTATAGLGHLSRTVVKLRSGPDGWVALPPSHMTRWDTPPWDHQGEPIELLDADDIHEPISLAVKGAC
ncbi:hypothetical protein GCM10017744_102180 [Streptomyces antimycoticus]|uniref:Uncharacterized protein n=1 Tax=Streptomyces antimycoticus TaxID=68175 RepID=A0A4D4KJC5_9ACTN|nr:hypothetical protein [Streptomyces antimycoticus]GDY49251.1 hypothetical protein SANT12839_101330 [Streptomyces antimycoticus]